MRVALFGAGWVVVSVVLAGLVFIAAAIGRARRDDDGDDFTEWAVELFGADALLGEVSG